MLDNSATTGHSDVSGSHKDEICGSASEAVPFTEQEINAVKEAVREVSSDPLGVAHEVIQELDLDYFAADYWDASTMGLLNPISLAAIARLRAYQPPAFPLWDRLPVNRRAAVLILLYADRGGDLRVVITMRAASLRSFSGQAAFPGGKADTTEETPYEIARREAWEEIGLPMDDAKIPAPFTIEQLCYLPHSLARTGLVVRPCVALLHVDQSAAATAAAAAAAAADVPTVDESLIPRLDAKEVAAVFSAPFHNFLRASDEDTFASSSSSSSQVSQVLKPTKFPPGNWYEGNWTSYHGHPWRLHFFHVPVDRQRVTRPKVREGGQAALAEPEPEDVTRFKVWGMTGRMLVDAAMVAYGEEPEFEHNEHYGDEALILSVERQILENKL